MQWNWNRRRFIHLAATTAATVSIPASSFAVSPLAVTFVVDPQDDIATSAASQWAIGQLTQALKSKGMAVRQAATLEKTVSGDCTIVIAGSGAKAAKTMLDESKVVVAQVPEALTLVADKKPGKLTLLACGFDARGLVYALTELTDIVQTADDPLAALSKVQTVSEQPANQVRSMTRLFCSEVEDKPWYNDREMWPRYFDMLAAQRFNRFNLAFGIGYDFIRKVTDAYFLFTYPFMLQVSGYSVRVPQLSDAERDRNLAMLQYISEQCVMRGIEFHVGLWMLGFVWIDSPNPNYTIEGLDKATHGAYCRDAVRLLLQKVPNIQGLTFRIHGESGVEEGSFDFWKTVFDGVATCGRKVPIDMHAKGMSQQMIQIALDTKQPVQLSPKFWGEHMGMPYHQADIREIEKPKATNRKGLMALSEGTRSFLRYGYGDLLTEDRKYSVVHRIWPGTQRVLLWGDPTFAAGYSRAFSFCGSNGVEIQEPLSFKGRRGSGHAGNRCAYADASYSPRWDWEKFEYGTRIWGRMLYNPETKPEVLRRSLNQQFGQGAIPLETALSNVSRILPIITTSHAPSAGNNTYWPELYFNQSLVDAAHYGPYGDSPAPRVFGMTSALDPALFLSINEHAENLLAGKSSYKYSLIEVAQWIGDYASAGRKALAQADSLAKGRGTAAYKRAKVDIQIQAGVGEFFAAKFRAGVLFHIFELTRNAEALKAAITQYTLARSAWANAANVAKGIYMEDITLGEEPQLRGHWLDRLPAMDKDIAALQAMLSSATNAVDATSVSSAMKSVLAQTHRVAVNAQHAAPKRFNKGESLYLILTAPAGVSSVRLHYRHVDQAESYVVAAMSGQRSKFEGTIPGTYTETEFPLEYFFEINDGRDSTTFHPGFSPERNNQPYYVVRSV